MLAFISAYTQHSLPDSIARKYANSPQDSQYVERLNSLATEYLRTTPTVARHVSEHTLEVSSRIGYTRGYSRALTIMGNSYWYEGMYEFAQNYYLLAARQYESIHDSIGLGQTYNNIGEVYKKLAEHNKALEYLLRAVDLKKGDSSSQAVTYYNIGELYIKSGEINKGKEYISKSFSIASAKKDKRVLAFDYWSFAAIKEYEGDLKGALDYYIKAEKIWRESGDTRSLIQTYQDMGEVYRKMKMFSDADRYLSLALQLAKRQNVPDLQLKNYERFAKLDSNRGDFSSALRYMSLHNQLKDSVYNLSKTEQIARLQTIYETENRERENQQLRTEKELRDSQIALQSITLAAISVGLILAAIAVWVLYRQRKKISFQKQAIEVQAGALLKLNEELQQLNRNLEARIDQRTSQLSLQNKRLAEFTFLNAHKLRAPVASILGLINLLYHSTEQQEKETILAHLRTCSEELDTTIREVSKNLEEAIVKETKH